MAFNAYFLAANDISVLFGVVKFGSGQPTSECFHRDLNSGKVFRYAFRTDSYSRNVTNNYKCTDYKSDEYNDAYDAAVNWQR